MADTQKPYEVSEEDDKFVVRDENGMALLTCATRIDAEHYAELANRAYDRGFRAGRKSKN